MSIPKKNQLVGLDIGSSSIKVVELEHGRRGRVLKNLGMALLPPDAIVEGSINRADMVSSAISGLFDNLKIKNRNVAASISGFSVITKNITLALDYEDEDKIEDSIRNEAEQYIPFDIDEVNIDFDILSSDIDSGSEENEDSAEEDSGRLEVMVVAAKKQIVNDYISVLEDANLVPSVLDVDTFALQNAFEISHVELDSDGCVALVNIGSDEIGINIVKEGLSLFTRVLSHLGGHQINESIMSELEVGYEEAEQIKLGGRDVAEKEALGNVITSVVSGWVQELKRNFDFVSSSYPDETIHKIFLSGGSAALPGFLDYLTQETQIPVFELNPFANLIIDKKSFDPEYINSMASRSAVAVGLALRSIGDK